jgi:hypothetical protein
MGSFLELKNKLEVVEEIYSPKYSLFWNLALNLSKDDQSRASSYWMSVCSLRGEFKEDSSNHCTSF